MLSSLVAVISCLLASAVAQTPPGYTWANSSSPLYLKFYGFPIFPAGSILPYAEPTYEPRLFASSPLNGTYLAFLVDANYNNSATIPAEVLWIASGVTFSQTPTAVIGQNGSVYGAQTSNSSKVPYLTPSVPGHTYITLLYNSPPNFEFPPNFPYNATFRTGFNVTRIGADFKSPTIEANYFTIAGNGSATASATGGVPHPTGTGHHGPGGYSPTAIVEHSTGSANSLQKMVEARKWTGPLFVWTVTAAIMVLL